MYSAASSYLIIYIPFCIRHGTSFFMPFMLDCIYVVCIISPVAPQKRLKDNLSTVGLDFHRFSWLNSPDAMWFLYCLQLHIHWDGILQRIFSLGNVILWWEIIFIFFVWRLSFFLFLHLINNPLFFNLHRLWNTNVILLRWIRMHYKLQWLQYASNWKPNKRRI